MKMFRYAALLLATIVLASGTVFAQQKTNPAGLAGKSTGNASVMKQATGQKAVASHKTVAADFSRGLKSSKGLIPVLILTPDSSGYQIIAGMNGYTDIALTEFPKANLGSLTVNDLLPYSVVIVYNDLTWTSAGGDPVVVGDVLKSYIDAGGKVIDYLFLHSFDSWGLQGGYITSNYSCFGTTTADDYNATALGTVAMPTHPLMAGVSTLSSTFDTQDPQLAAGADLIASWANGNIAIAAKPNVVGINLLPYDPNSAALGFTGDGWTLFHNAIVWLSGPTTEGPDVSPTQLTNPVSTTVFNASDSIRVKVVNNDSLAIVKVPISYSIDGGALVHDTIPSIAGDANVIFTFKQPYSFSLVNHVYDVMIYTHIAADTNYVNDTLHATVTNTYDAASISYDGATVLGPGTINPMATVGNNSSLAASFDVTMTIQGGYTSTKSVTSLAPGATIQLTFDPWTAALGTYDLKVYTSLAQDNNLTNDTLKTSLSVQTLKKAYCYVAYQGSGTLPLGPAYTYLQNPSTTISIADQSAEGFIAAGTWGRGNVWLGFDYATSSLVSLDTVTGARTVLGSTGVNLSGLAYDYSANKLYGVSWDGASSLLYEINQYNGASTLIGTCGTQLLINLACDLSGNLYAAAITDDNLYSVNKSTGASTLIGPLGVDISYAQDMEFDHYSSTLYMTAYTTGGEIRTVNTTTGATTLIGAFDGGPEITGLAIPYSTTLPATDLALTSINNLKSACNLSNAATFSITVKNVGTSPITAFDAHFSLDGGAVINESVTTTIAPGASYTYNATATLDLSALGNHNMVAYVGTTGDTESWNDTLSIDFNHVALTNVPFTMGFESSEDLSGWQIFDANADGNTWFVSTSGGNTAPACLVYEYTSANAADEWMISTCFNFESGKTYNLSFYYKAQSSSYPEALKFSIGTGNQPSDMTTVITALPSISETAYTPGSANFTVPATGTYYIGIGCYSDADMWNLFVDDINITESNAVNETEARESISVYPNPVSGVLHITSSSLLQRIRITNMVGSVVYDNNVNALQHQINTESMMQGMYFITVETTNGSTTQKFIVK